MEKNNNILVKILIVIITIFILIAVIYYSIVNGIASMIQGFFTGMVDETTASVREGLGSNSSIHGNIEGQTMQAYIINEEQVSNLKSSLEVVNIDTNNSGLTEVRLRKILLAYTVSTSFADTLSAVPVSKEEIIRNINEKEYGKDFTSIDQFTSYCDDNGKTKKSDEVWPISDPIYNLYYDSDIFFYFRDSDKKFGENSEQWYLGAMGATTITTEDGTELNYYDQYTFEQLKNNYELLPAKDKEGSEEEARLLKAYTRVDATTIKVYKIITDSKKYNYMFDNKNIEKIELEGMDEESQYTVQTVELNLDNQIDTSSYAISTELIIDLLDITGSGHFIEEFIDYSIEKTSVKVKAYTTIKCKYTYDKTEYNIKDNFILEMYDMINFGTNSTGDIGDDNFKVYKSLIFDRKYLGQIFDGRITDLANFENIDYDDANIQVDKINTYLKTAYNPPNGFDLGTITVTEIITKIQKENNWELRLSEVGTWYGDVKYSDPIKETIYKISDSIVSEEDFNNFDYNDLSNSQNLSDENKKMIYLSDTLNGQSPVTQSDEVIVVQGGEDLYANTLTTEVGKQNLSHFWNWTVRGLANIAINDGSADYNDSLGGGTGCDYIFSKYTKTKIKDYTEENKTKDEVLNLINVTKSYSNIDQKLKEFLELLKNETGKIPNNVGDCGGFKENGIAVEYEDIYNGKVLAGDALLDNGALMLFELLESTESTQSLVNVFKYLAYLYTGVDYGVSLESLERTSNIFDTNAINSDIIVKTDEENALPALEKDELIVVINNSYFSEQAKNNLLDNIDAILEAQNKYKVSALFIISILQIESNCGTGWGLIDSTTHNWGSVMGRYLGEYSYIDINGTEWKRYPSFAAATDDLGYLIENTYFNEEMITVLEIGYKYCEDGEGWVNAVTSTIEDVCEESGIEIPRSVTEVPAGGVEEMIAFGSRGIGYSLNGCKSLGIISPNFSGFGRFMVFCFCIQFI